MAKEDSRREVPISGWYACLSLFDRRPGDIKRIIVDPRKAKLLGHVLAWASKKRLPYRTESGSELARLARTTHHEGIVVIARDREVFSLSRLREEPVTPGSILLALDSVANPHNLGAILRTTAFFGVGGVILGGPESPSRLSPAVMRTSQGGAEEVRVFRCEELASALSILKGRGLTVIGTDVFGKDVFEVLPRLPAAGKDSICLVLGSERGGLSPAARDLCDHLVRVPGRGSVESLNVSVACGVLLALLVGTQRRVKGRTPESSGGSGG